MSEINIYTYEIYLLDFFEGVLNKKLEGELRLFLKKHPNIAIDLDENPVNFYLSSEKEIFVRKGAILKDERAAGFTNLVIAEIEGVITPEEKVEKENLIALYPYLNQEEKLAKQAVLYPNYEQQFSRKKQLLKKTGIGRRVFVYWSGAAASVAIILAMFFLKETNQYEPINLAKNTFYSDDNPTPIVISDKNKEQLLVDEKELNLASIQTASVESTEINQRQEEVFEVQKMDAESIAVFESNSPTLLVPKNLKIEREFSPTMAMTDQKLDLMLPAELMTQFFGEIDTTEKERKGFTLRIGKLIILQFGKKKNKEK